MIGNPNNLPFIPGGGGPGGGPGGPGGGSCPANNDCDNGGVCVGGMAGGLPTAGPNVCYSAGSKGSGSMGSPTVCKVPA